MKYENNERCLIYLILINGGMGWEWRGKKTMGNMNMHRRIVAEKNKLIIFQRYTPTRHAPSCKNNMFAKATILTGTQIKYNPLVVEAWFSVGYDLNYFLSKSRKLMKFSCLFSVIVISMGKGRVKLIVLLKKYTHLPFYSFFIFTTVC